MCEGEGEGVLVIMILKCKASHQHHELVFSPGVSFCNRFKTQLVS